MTLPLFPLNTVLFPGCILDLQLFEARYLDMIGRCMKQGSGFGVVCIMDGEEVGEVPDAVSVTGCEALIRDFRQQDNGLLGIRVEGGRRFDLTGTDIQRDNLMLAQVRWRHEHPDQDLSLEHEDLHALLQALAEHPMVSALGMDAEGVRQQALGHRLAYLLPFTSEDKLELLEIDDPTLRLERIQDMLDLLQDEPAS